VATPGTRKAAFEAFDITLKNNSWSLSGRTDGAPPKVAVSIWENELSVVDGKRVYDRPSWGNWYSGPGRKFLFEDLAWARTHCDGIVRIVLVTRATEDGREVKAKKSRAAHDLIMRVIHTDPEVGAFRFEEV
jgi:hypothetical protein